LGAVNIDIREEIIYTVDKVGLFPKIGGVKSMYIQINRMHHNDWETVRSIYTGGIASGDATFETLVPD